ncbi:diacylglycerol/polyprenol kinase family protein [Thermococcus sp.]
MSIKRELKRKALHLTGLIVPAVYVLSDKTVTLMFIGTAMIAFLVLEPFRIVEAFRDKIKKILRIYVQDEVISTLEKNIDEITREEERGGIAAHIYFAAGAFIVVYFFSKDIAIGAIAVATVGDAMAAIIGKTFGRHRFANGKSVEGSLAYFFSALAILLLLMNFPHAIVGAIAGMVAEFYDFPPDDNFSNQLAIAVTLYLSKMIV